MVNFNYQLNNLQTVSMRECLHWVGLWVCLCGLLLNKLNEMGILSLLWAMIFPRQGFQDYVRIQVLNLAQAIKQVEHVCVHFSLLLTVDSV